MISQIFRGDNENTAVKRKRQIDTLKIFNDNVVELRENAEYQVEFDVGDKRMAIIVSLSPEFPLEKPVLRVSPSILHHPWCNEQSEIITAPGLLNFTVYSDLGRVVQAIIREFSKNPPSQLHGDASLTSNISHRSELQGERHSAYSLQRYADVHSAAAYNLSCYNSQYPKYSSPNATICKYNSINASCVSEDEHIAVPSTSYHLMYTNKYHHHHHHRLIINLEFPELNNVSIERLINLNEEGNTSHLDDFLNEYSSSPLEDIHLSIDKTIDSVQEMANKNLAKETELKLLHDEIALKMQTVSALKARYDNLIHQYNKLSEAFAPHHIRECLKNAADISNENSEKIAENFLEQKIDVEHFLSTYIECRKLGQTRRTKEEKLAHQLDELKRAGY